MTSREGDDSEERIYAVPWVTRGRRLSCAALCLVYHEHVRRALQEKIFDGGMFLSIGGDFKIPRKVLSTVISSP